MNDVIIRKVVKVVIIIILVIISFIVIIIILVITSFVIIIIAVIVTTSLVQIIRTDFYRLERVQQNFGGSKLNVFANILSFNALFICFSSINLFIHLFVISFTHSFIHSIFQSFLLQRISDSNEVFEMNFFDVFNQLIPRGCIQVHRLMSFSFGNLKKKSKHD